MNYVSVVNIIFNSKYKIGTGTYLPVNMSLYYKFYIHIALKKLELKEEDNNVALGKPIKLILYTSSYKMITLMRTVQLKTMEEHLRTWIHISFRPTLRLSFRTKRETYS